RPGMPPSLVDFCNGFRYILGRLKRREPLGRLAMTYRAPVADIAFALKHAAWFAPALAEGLYGDLSEDVIDAVIEEAGRFATEVLRRAYLPKLVSGAWTGTMQLTEPQAGSDVGALRTRAERAGDGSYRISGQKIFITYGEHDLTDNIIHLVLARLPDAPPGTRGIPLFVVPKFLLNADRSLRPRYCPPFP